MDIKRQFKEKPISTVSMIVGILTGFITLGAFSTDAIKITDKYIVTEAELIEMEVRIIDQIQQEAIITREVIIGEILVRKNRLQHELELAETEGEIARILLQINDLNRQLDKIKGVSK